MFRTNIDNAHLKRTIRPLYGWNQATPTAGFLDPDFDRSVPVWPGMVFMKTVGDNYTLIDGTGDPAGLVGLFIGGDGIDELLQQGINALAVWTLDPTAEFEILAPAFDTEATWTEPTDGTTVLVHASTTGDNQGKLVPAGAANASAKPVARLVRVVSPTKIVIGGLRPADVQADAGTP